MQSNPSAVFAGCSRHIIGPDGKVAFLRSAFPKSGVYSGRQVIKKCLWAGTNLIGEPTSALLRSAELKAVPLLDPETRYWIDFDFWTRLLMRGDMYFDVEPLAQFRIHGKAATRNFERRMLADFLILADRRLSEMGASRDRAAPLASRQGSRIEFCATPSVSAYRRPQVMTSMADTTNSRISGAFAAAQRLLRRESVLFLVIGGINTLLNYAFYLACLLFFTYTVSFTISYVTGLVMAYCLNSLLVFKERMRMSSFLRYPIVYVVQYLIGITLALRHRRNPAHFSAARAMDHYHRHYSGDVSTESLHYPTRFAAGAAINLIAAQPIMRFRRMSSCFQAPK